MSEFAWLIEISGHLPVYWDGRGDDTFDWRHDVAVRFARREDAERIIEWMISPKCRAECRAIEHGWIATPPAPAPTGEGLAADDAMRAAIDHARRTAPEPSPDLREVAEVRALHADMLACDVCREVSEQWEGPGMCEGHAARTAALLTRHFGRKE